MKKYVVEVGSGFHCLQRTAYRFEAINDKEFLEKFFKDRSVLESIKATFYECPRGHFSNGVVIYNFSVDGQEAGKLLILLRREIWSRTRDGNRTFTR